MDLLQNIRKLMNSLSFSAY